MNRCKKKQKTDKVDKMQTTWKKNLWLINCYLNIQQSEVIKSGQPSVNLPLI